MGTYKNDLEEHLLINLHELLVPLLDVGGLLAGVGLVILCLDGIVAVVLAPLDDLSHDGLVDLVQLLAKRASWRWRGEGRTYIGDGDRVVGADISTTEVVEKVLDEHGALNNGTVCIASAVSREVDEGWGWKRKAGDRRRCTSPARESRLTDFDNGAVARLEPDLLELRIGHVDYGVRVMLVDEMKCLSMVRRWLAYSLAVMVEE